MQILASLMRIMSEYSHSLWMYLCVPLCISLRARLVHLELARRGCPRVERRLQRVINELQNLFGMLDK